MAKAKKYYLCQECGYKSVNWMGKCSNCGSWDSFEEVIAVSYTHLTLPTTPYV